MNPIVCETPAELAARAADLIVEIAREAIRQRGRFTWVLAGGSTPGSSYLLLAHPERAAAIAWEDVFVFLGDERMVPPDDPRSNFGMARQTLLDRVPIPAAHLFPILTEAATAPAAAAEYEARLKRFFATDESASLAGGWPQFDLILLGLGEDGHTASLFPGAAALEVEYRWVTSSPPGSLPPPFDRVTLTFPVLNHARHVVFLVSGKRKAAVLREVLAGNTSRADWPAAGVRPIAGELTWLVDRAAADRR